MSYFDEEDWFDFDECMQEAARRPLKCSRCGSTDVRWRQQGGRWVLFTLRPGVEHACTPPAGTDEFEVVQ